jgi:16S rRNA (cytosine967-C5)-methyltransferase
VARPPPGRRGDRRPRAASGAPQAIAPDGGRIRRDSPAGGTGRAPERGGADRDSRRRPGAASDPSAGPGPAGQRRAERPERPLREDLVVQAALEAYGAVRHDGWLADRALERVLRTKRHLYSNERRAVAERVYALLRRQRTVDALLARAGARLEGRSTEQDLLRLAASRVLHGESAEHVARTSGLRPDESRVLDVLPGAAAAVRA